MANVGTAAVGKTLVGAGNGRSPTYVDIGAGSGLTDHGVVIAQGTDAFIALGTGTAGQVLQSGGSSADPSYSTATYPSTAGANGNVLTSDGTNWTSSAPPSGGGIVNLEGDDVTTVTGTTVHLLATPGMGPSFAFIYKNANELSLEIDQSVTQGLILGTISSLPSGSTDNTGFGLGVFQSATSPCSNNCAFGLGSSITLGGGSGNCFFGNHSGTTVYGSDNCGFGTDTSQVAGSENTSIGSNTLFSSGDRNIAVGFQAGVNFSSNESGNILIGSPGVASDNNIIRIGDPNDVTYAPVECYIAGITGVTVTGAAVLVSSTGQLGVSSSSIRFKDNVLDMNDSSEKLFDLRPVNFNYKNNLHEMQYGLIAEEVDQVFPHLVVRDKQGKPEGIKYHELPVMLLNEIQKLSKRVKELELKNG